MPIHARPTSSVERVVKWARRRPAVAALMAAVVLVSALGVAGIAAGWQKALAAEGAARYAEGKAIERADAEAQARAEEEKARHREEQAKKAFLKSFLDAMKARREAREAEQKEAAARKKAEDLSSKEFAARLKEEEQRKKAEAERDAKQRALVRADGLRLNAEAAAARHSDPALAMLLSLEAVQRTPHRLTFATLHDAVRDCRELRTIYGTGVPLRYTRDGALLVSPTSTCDETGKQVARAPEWRKPNSWLDLSPDGRRAVSLMEGYQAVYYRDGKEPPKHMFTDRVAYIWDTRTGKDVVHLRKHIDRIVSARFSPDGKQIVTASWDNTAILWDAGTGQRLHELRGHQCSLQDALFSSDGARVLTVSSGRNTIGHGMFMSKEEAANPNAPALRERDPGAVERTGRAGEGG